MTVNPNPGDRSYDFSAALDHAADGLASSICDAISSDLSEARLEPVVRALTDIGVTIDTLLDTLRRTRSNFAAGTPATTAQPQAGPARL